jgi:hypothetical protein
MHRSSLLAPLAALVLTATLGACTSGAAVRTTTEGSTAATTTVAGVTTAGPVCPVARPDDPACAPRPVAGAILVVTEPDGTEVARATSGADGRFGLHLPAGSYILVPQAVVGLMGTADPIPFSVRADGASPPVPLQVEYDTGIR